MAYRTQLVLSGLLTTLLLTLGCGYNQQSRFQMSFLPATPHNVVSPADFVDAPSLQPNLYLHDVPPFLSQPPAPVLPATRGDILIRRAEQRFQSGKKFYQAKDTGRARTEFDAAIDLMFEASANHPGDREAYEKRLDEMVNAIHRYDLAGFGASAAGLDEARFEKAPLEDILEMTFPVDPRLKNRVQAQIQATVSQLPLSENNAILGYIHYFSGRGRKTLIAGLRRAGRYKPLVQRILDEEGVPQELIHLAQAESGFLPRAVSRKAAVGMWQFVKWRGQQYGLMQTPYSDDRLDPEKATRASARHLRDLYHQFGDWYLAIAAYNCGPGVIEKAVERTGYADFWELRERRVIPAETTNYVPIILAMTIMEKNAAEYGLTDVAPDAPMEYDTVEIASPTHLALVADLTDAPLSELVSLNPALLKGVAPQGYSLRVPKATGATLMASLQIVPPERRASWRMHKVETGETLAGIGKRYGAAPSTILAANGLAGGDPVAGDRLVIPAAYTSGKVAAARAATRSVKRAASGHRTSGARTASTRRRSSKAASARAKAPARPAAKGPRVLTRTASAKHAPSSN